MTGRRPAPLYGTALAAAGLLLLGGCRLSDVRTTTVNAPGVRCGQCAEIVHRALWALVDDPPATLRPVPEESAATLRSESDTGTLRRIEFDLATGAIVVTYDSMRMALKNLEFAVASAGFDVEAEPFPLAGDPSAREALPPECRAHAR